MGIGSLSLTATPPARTDTTAAQPTVSVRALAARRRRPLHDPGDVAPDAKASRGKDGSPVGKEYEHAYIHSTLDTDMSHSSDPIDIPKGFVQTTSSLRSRLAQKDYIARAREARLVEDPTASRLSATCWGLCATRLLRASLTPFGQFSPP